MLYEALRQGHTYTLGELLELYEKQWAKSWHFGIRTGPETEQEQLVRGARCIENYYRAYQPFAESRTEILEETVEFPLDLGWCGERFVIGKIDRLASRPDGTYEIHDYKTGKLNDDNLAKSWRQLTLYQCVIQFSHPEIRNVELVLHYLEYGENFRRAQTRPEIAETLRDTKREIIYVESQVSFPPNPSLLCDWCEFRDGCPARV
jgi:RecB family exonuclease